MRLAYIRHLRDRALKNRARIASIVTVGTWSKKGNTTMQKTTETTAEKRTIATIAREIKRLWARPYFGSVPYLDAMLVLETTDRDASYGLDSARSIVTYFLSNATTWRGDDARRIKKELKAYSY